MINMTQLELEMEREMEREALLQDLLEAVTTDESTATIIYAALKAGKINEVRAKELSYKYGVVYPYFGVNERP